MQNCVCIFLLHVFNDFSAIIYLFKVNSENTRKRCEIFSKLTIKTLERRHWRRSGVFIVNFEHISLLFLLLLLLTLSKLMLAGLWQFSFLCSWICVSLVMITICFIFKIEPQRSNVLVKMESVLIYLSLGFLACMELPK